MWKFNVKNIGRVSEAEIAVAPLVMLLGKNNTGKSYIATLTWALTHIGPLLARDDARNRQPQWFKDFLVGPYPEAGALLEVTQDRANELIAYLNSELEINGASFLSDVFAFSGFDRTEIKFEPCRPFEPFTVLLNESDGSETPRRTASTTMRIFDNTDKNSVSLRFPRGPNRLPALRVEQRGFLEILYRVMFGPGRTTRYATYIPAARTGLMLAYRALVARMFDTPSSEETSGIVLPRPLANFLQDFSFRSGFPDDHRHGQIARWLEKEVVHGKFEIEGDEVPTILYRPEDSDLSVPLHAASSMITEIAPFLILLNDGLGRSLVIFEEPEAHLHLEAQRTMARALARLLNTGTPVMVTSHSDTFVQQINNLMHLYKHPRREELVSKLGYEIADLINPTDAKAYEFVEEQGQTIVTELERQPSGFAVPSLNATLFSLAEETIALDRNDD